MVNKLESFKKTTEGKYIHAFGTLLVVSAVLTLLSAFLCLIATVNSSEPTYMLYAFIFIPVGIALLVIGPKIRRYDYSPSQLRSIGITLLFVSLFASLRLFIVIESIMLLTKWNKKYAQAYEASNVKKADSSTKVPRVKDKTDDKNENSSNKSDEYEDDMI